MNHLDVKQCHEKLKKGDLLTDNELEILEDAYTKTLEFLPCFGNEHILSENEIHRCLLKVREYKRFRKEF